MKSPTGPVSVRSPGLLATVTEASMGRPARSRTLMLGATVMLTWGRMVAPSVVPAGSPELGDARSRNVDPESEVSPAGRTIAPKLPAAEPYVSGRKATAGPGVNPGA